jgi:formate dehydrogenase accessory protein FdhE
MKETWDSRIHRAEQLASKKPESNELLRFYGALLRTQKEIYEYLRTRKNWLPSGDIERDLQILQPQLPTLLHTVEKVGSDLLVSQATALLHASESESGKMIIDYWKAPSDTQFFAKAFLQPYAVWLREIGAQPPDRALRTGENRCPFCCSKPQVSVLEIKETSSESGGRDLVCALCLLAWPFRRVVCANCLEENPAQIGYYHSPEYDHVRVEACDTCGHYIKGIDLTRYGLAIPLIDEVSAAPLDLWARDKGYTKIEMNLVGL